MKKIMTMAIGTLMLAACHKEVMLDNATPTELQSKMNSGNQAAKTRVTRPITNALESDPDPNTTSVYGGVLFYGTTSHLGKVYGKTVNTSFTPLSEGVVSITSDDITYAANGDELWTKGSIVVRFPTDGSVIATIEGGSIITGGTGRFVGATGYFIYENMVYNIITGHESHTSYGEITY